MATDHDGVGTTAMSVKKHRSKSWLIVLFLMLGEGVAVFLATKLLFAPVPSPSNAVTAPHGQGAIPEGRFGTIARDNAAFAGGAQGPLTEVELSECRPVNKISGKLITIRMRVSMLVRDSEVDNAKKLVEANRARIEDRINLVIRSADPSHLNEPALETVKRRMRAELDVVFGDETLIQEILIPEMLPSGL